MVKQLGKPITGQNLVVLKQIQEFFLTLCEQYEHMGSLFKLQSKTLTHPVFAPSSAPAVHKRLLQQYKEIGDQLKNIGFGLDSLEGKEVPEKEKTFVSNIAPRDITGEGEIIR